MIKLIRMSPEEDVKNTHDRELLLFDSPTSIQVLEAPTPVRDSQKIYLEIKPPEGQPSTPARSQSPDRFFLEQPYNTIEDPGFTISPRYGFFRLNTDDIVDIPAYAPIDTWFRNNVFSYLENKAFWSNHVPPQRFLYIYGPQGMGKATKISNICRIHKINFLFVRNNFDDPQTIIAAVNRAKQMSPCVLYFDAANSVVESHMSTLQAAFFLYLNSSYDNVWTVVSAYVNPTLSYDRGFNEKPENASLVASFESMCSLVKEHGSFISVPYIQSFETARSIVPRMIQNMVLNSAMAREMETHEWVRVINRIANSSVLCTIKELYEFVKKAIQAHYQSGAPSALPTARFFEDQLNTLAISANSFSGSLVISTRNVKEDNSHCKRNIDFGIQIGFFPTPPLPPTVSTPSTPTPAPTPAQINSMREAERVRRQTTVSKDPDDFFSLLSAPPTPFVQPPPPPLPPPPSPPPLPRVFKKPQLPPIPPVPQKTISAPIPEESSPTPTQSETTHRKRSNPPRNKPKINPFLNEFNKKQRT